MVNPTIYTVGGTVQANARGVYIPRQADEELLQLCRESTFAYVLTPRQMGKSSLMIRTAEQLMDQGSQAVIIDLTQIGTQLTADEWYGDFLDLVASQLLLSTNVKQWWQAHAQSGTTLRLTRFFQEVLLTEVTEPIVIFVDEIDTTLSLDFTDDFYAAIRYLYVARSTDANLRRLSFVLIGVATPADLIRDPKRTPFNIGTRVDLTDFTAEEALPLAAGLGLPSEQGQQVLDWGLQWTSGHPYLTQRLCRALVERPPTVWSANGVAAVVAETFLGDRSEQDNNLQFVRDMLTKRAPQNLEQEVLQTYRQVYRRRQPVLDEEQNLVKSHLKLSGVVRREGKDLQVRNRIYRDVFNQQWIQKHLPENFWQRYKPVLRVAIPVTAASLVVAVVMVGLAEQARQNAKEAATQRAIAQQSAEAAQQSEQRAQEALSREQNANAQRTIALETAERQRQRAEEQAGIAQEQTRRAETQTEIAQNQTRIATREQQRAEQQTTVAQLREQVARVFNLLPTANAVPGVILAIDTMDRSWALSEQSLERTAQASLLSAVQTSQEINRLQGRDLVSAVAFSPDGQRMASGGRDGTVQLWNVWTGNPMGELLQGHETWMPNDWVTTFAFSPDGKYIVSGGLDWTIRRWDAQTGQPIGNPIQENEEVNTVAVSPDSKWIASSTPYAVINLWDIETGELIRELEGHGGSGTGVTSVAFSPDGKYIASGGDDQTVRLWDARTGELIVEPLQYESMVTSVAFSSDSRRIAISEDIRVWVWDVELEEHITEPLQGHQDSVLSVAFSPDGQQIVTGSRDDTVRLWDVEEGQPIGQPFLGHEADVNSVAFSLNGQRIVSGSDDWTIRLWDAKYGQPIGKLLQDHGNSISLVLNSNGQWITGSWDGTVRFWDAWSTLSGESMGEPLQDYSGRLIAFSLSGQRIVSRDRDNKVWLWDVQTGRSIGELIQGSQSEVRSVAFDSHGQRIVSGGQDGTVQIWDARTGQATSEPTQLHFDTNYFWALAFAPDDQTIVSGDRDGTIRLLNTSTGQLIGAETSERESGLVTSAVESVAFGPDGQRVVSGGRDNTLRLWSAQTGQPIGTPIRGHQGWVRSVAFSPDGQRIVSSGNDRTLRLWDAQTGEPIGDPLRGHTGLINSVAFSPDGQQIIGTSLGNKVWLWDVSPESWLAIACNRLQYHPFLIQPETAFTDQEFIQVAQRARAACQRRVWQPSSMTSQNSPSWLGDMFYPS